MNIGNVFGFLYNSYYTIFIPINVQCDTVEMMAEKHVSIRVYRQSLSVRIKQI
jgi:hypothetical protein